MVLFSRSFARKRMNSLATTASVAATTFALADDPARMDRLCKTMRVADRLHRSDAQTCLSGNDVANNEIEAGGTITPTGDVMTPQHRGAADMAKQEQKYGHSELRRLVREIIAIHQKEIGVMRDASNEAPSSALQSASINGAVAGGGMQISQ
jgi:hypothetical protein